MWRWSLLSLLGLLVLVSLAHAGRVSLAWNYPQSTNPAGGFLLYRQPRCQGAYSQVNGHLPRIPLAYTDTQVQRGVTYCWYVVATNAAGEVSPRSNILRARARR